MASDWRQNQYRGGNIYSCIGGVCCHYYFPFGHTPTNRHLLADTTVLPLGSIALWCRVAFIWTSIPFPQLSSLREGNNQTASQETLYAAAVAAHEATRWGRSQAGCLPDNQELRRLSSLFPAPSTHRLMARHQVVPTSTLGYELLVHQQNTTYAKCSKRTVASKQTATLLVKNPQWKVMTFNKKKEIKRGNESAAV